MGEGVFCHMHYTHVAILLQIKGSHELIRAHIFILVASEVRQRTIFYPSGVGPKLFQESVRWVILRLPLRWVSFWKFMLAGNHMGRPQEQVVVSLAFSQATPGGLWFCHTFGSDVFGYTHYFLKTRVCGGCKYTQRRWYSL